MTTTIITAGIVVLVIVGAIVGLYVIYHLVRANGGDDHHG